MIVTVAEVTCMDSYIFHASGPKPDCKEETIFRCYIAAELETRNLWSDRRMDSNDDGLGRSGQQMKERIVIVGGGIGGLACALALHRVGLRAVVLESAESLRFEGTCITLWTNAMRVLEVLGIADKFRTMYHNIPEGTVFDARGKFLKRMPIAEVAGVGESFRDWTGAPSNRSHEMRSVERKVLLESLAAKLPAGTIRFKSHVEGIEQSKTSPGVTNVHLRDGSVYSAQVVLGFDGQNSVVAKWMGLEPPQLVGQVAIRGMAEFPDGHNFDDAVSYILGKGTRAACVPVDDTKVYWFVLWNDWSTGFRDSAPEQMKAEALSHLGGFQRREKIELCINHTPPEHFTKNSIRHRINTLPPASQVVGGVTLGGDASHPTCPNLGQGGGMALEDAILLTRALYPVLKGDGSDAAERIHAALVAHQEARHARTHSLSVRAYRMGNLMQSEWTVVCLLRDWVLLPLAYNPTTALDHALFDVGELPRRSCTLTSSDVEEALKAFQKP